MASLDTNLLLRLVLADVPGQRTKVESLFEQPSGKYQVADMVFAEMVWILQGTTYSFSRQDITDKLRSVLAIPQINCNRPMLDKALDLYVNYPGISFIDACLSVYAELNDAVPLLTFDKKLASALPKTAAVL